jgi:hypothetical protein
MGGVEGGVHRWHFPGTRKQMAAVCGGENAVK